MAYRIKHRSRAKVQKDNRFLVKHIDRETKENYLKRIGLYKEEAIEEMSDNQLNELVEVALEVKGYGILK